jgi:hypothetical protein
MPTEPGTAGIWQIRILGATSWLMLTIIAFGGEPTWYVGLELVVFYLVLHVIFQMARRNARIPRQLRQWLFIP